MQRNTNTKAGQVQLEELKSSRHPRLSHQVMAVARAVGTELARPRPTKRIILSRHCILTSITLHIYTYTAGRVARVTKFVKKFGSLSSLLAHLFSTPFKKSHHTHTHPISLQVTIFKEFTIFWHFFP